MNPMLDSAISHIPPGEWAVGVSGGADSIALLCLLLNRVDLHLHVVHLDHQTRGEHSTGDAQFVRQFCESRKIPHTIARRDQIEPLIAKPPANPSAFYRAMRFWLYADVVAKNKLKGVLLAHHADDQAETVLLRLIRGQGWRGLAGIRSPASIEGLHVLRPMLGVRRVVLRDYLQSIQQPWREDASNQSDDYQRNRVRKVLAANPDWFERLIAVSQSVQKLADYVAEQSPVLPDEFGAKKLAALPTLLQEESVMRWLISQNVPAGEMDSSTIRRLIEMTTDASTAARQQFPGGVNIIRKARSILSDRAGSL